MVSDFVFVIPFSLLCSPLRSSNQKDVTLSNKGLWILIPSEPEFDMREGKSSEVSIDISVIITSM